MQTVIAKVFWIWKRAKFTMFFTTTKSSFMFKPLRHNNLILIGFTVQLDYLVKILDAEKQKAAEELSDAAAKTNKGK